MEAAQSPFWTGNRGVFAVWRHFAPRCGWWILKIWKKKFSLVSYLIRKKFVQICFSSFFKKKLEKKRPVLPLRKFANPLPLPIGLTWDFPQRLELGKSNQYTIFSNFSNDAVKKKNSFLGSYSITTTFSKNSEIFPRYVFLCLGAIAPQMTSFFPPWLFLLLSPFMYKKIGMTM